MHLMEAMTHLYRASGQAQHRQLACELIDLLFEHMINPKTGLGISQFTYDWQPLRAILFKTVWGADRDADDGEARPMDNTSYGHNVEFGWLLNDAIGVLGLDRDAYLPKIRTLYDHCVEYGIDWQRGGVYCEGPAAGPARETNKEFWQQSETMIAMLDAVRWWGDEVYWRAYENVHKFVFDLMIHHDVGEWWPLFKSDNSRLWEYMSTAWKVNYHTIRGMLECERRLADLSRAQATEGNS
jgi:mannobiose 2-epimerase